jgi:uncharacterized repeat protein (TIGR01451 family)
VALIGQSRTNTAVIAGQLPDTDLSDNTATATTMITQLSQANVGIAKALTSAPATFYNGRKAVYTLTYSNTGDLPAANTLITDTIPPGLAFLAASRAPKLVASDKVVFDLGTLTGAVDATIALTFTVTAPLAGGTTIANTATIGTSTTPEPAKGNNTATASATTIAAPPPDLALTKAVDKTSVPFGDAITYLVTIANLGGRTATGIRLVDTLPEGLVYQPGSSGAAGDPAISNGGRTLTWNLPASFNLPTGAARSFQFRAIASRAKPGMLLVNNAVVQLAADPHTPNNSASSEATMVTGSVLYLPMIRR